MNVPPREDEDERPAAVDIGAFKTFEHRQRMSDERQERIDEA